MSSPPTDRAHPAPLPATGERLRMVLRDVPSPVVVVTAEGPDGPRGATIGSFTSVALDPPLVSINVTHGTQIHAALAEAEGFAVHLLDASQAEIAEHFAVADLAGEAQLAPFDHVRGAGPPLLRGTLGILLCTPHARFEAGDHTVVVGRVTHVVEGSGHDPLLYVRQSYRGIGERV